MDLKYLFGPQDKRLTVPNMEQQQILTKCQQRFDTIQNNSISLVFAKSKGDQQAIEMYTKKEKELVLEALKCEEADYFKMFFIAEYKEQVYECMFDPCFERIEQDVFNELERIIERMYTYEDIYNYALDTNHFLFKNKFYSFHEFVEAKGTNILDPWTED